MANSTTNTLSSDQPVVVEVVADNDVQLPAYATEGSAGLDLRAYINEPIELAPGETKLVPTGMRVAIPAGYEIQIRPRSGMALKHQVIPLNTPGTIDSDYRGEIQIILANLGKIPFIIEPGMRLAQAVLAKYEILKWQRVEELGATKRGTYGFGGTGIL